jgi:ligand-binding SRPBCC domain-containing protein
MRLKFEQKVDKNKEEVFSHFNEKLFLSLNPPWNPLKLLRFDGCSKKDEVHLLLGVPPFRQRWVSQIVSSYTTPSSIVFVDKGKTIPFPFKKWIHKHSVFEVSKNQSVVKDDIYVTFKWPEPLWNTLLYPLLYALFSYRPRAYKKFFSIL